MDLAGMISYVRAHRGGVAASVNAEGGPEAAYLEFAVTDHGELLFDTTKDSRKAINIAHNPRVAVVFGGPDGTTLQCEGLADTPTGAEREPYASAYLTAYPDYSLDDASSVLVRVRMSWARYGDLREDSYATEEVELPG